VRPEAFQRIGRGPPLEIQQDLAVFAAWIGVMSGAL